MNKFIKVPNESDTKIIYQQVAALGKYDILYQKWFWDGITAESIIFVDADISALDKNEIVKEVKQSPLLHADSQLTLTCSDGYTFVNFNFETE
jgi:hypothetical protein